MAWVRLAVSMITFGFTIYKFSSSSCKVAPRWRAASWDPRGFAFTMIAIGLLALLLSTIQHARACAVAVEMESDLLMSSDHLRPTGRGSGNEIVTPARETLPSLPQTRF